MSSRLSIFRRNRSHTAPRPLPRKVTDPRSLCMVQDCTDPHTVEVHGWRVCADHAPTR